jgi:hypothetical protein
MHFLFVFRLFGRGPFGINVLERKVGDQSWKYNQ